MKFSCNFELTNSFRNEGYKELSDMSFISGNFGPKIKLELFDVVPT